MALTIYNKLGKKSYKESKLVKDIQSAVEKKIAQNPELGSKFRPATTFEELQSLHREYCSTDVEYEEMGVSKEDDHVKFRDSMKESVEKTEPSNEIKTKELPEDDYSFTDPFNDADPIVRDYVMENNFDKNPSTNSETSSNNNFDEPTNFKDAFVMPDANTPNSTGGNNGGNNQKKQTKEEPLNPKYNEQSSGRKKRTNKKFAKYIVQAVCMLAEKGFVWWTTKDITESKVVEYELNGEMDLSILLTMQNGQKATVKQWFQSQRFKSEELGKYDKNEIEDLSDALAEVLDKKGISPSEEQELLIIAASVFGKKLMTAIEIKRDIGSVIQQLKEIQQSGVQAPRQDYSETIDYSKAEQEQHDVVQEQEDVVEQQQEEKHSVIADIEGNFGGITDLVTT